MLAAIACGGAIGATARYEMTLAMPIHSGKFPWATFWTNVTGSFVLGVILILLLERFRPTRYLQQFAVTGALRVHDVVAGVAAAALGIAVTAL